MSQHYSLISNLSVITPFIAFDRKENSRMDAILAISAD
jgi:hypothetical protein